VLGWLLSHVRADGLVGKLTCGPYVDGTSDFKSCETAMDCDGDSTIITLQLVSALRGAAELEATVGDSQTAKTYREAANRSADAVRSLCWNASLV
jgi:alpha-L-rhamnosidase